MRVRLIACVAVTFAAVAAGGSTASAADVLKVAVGQCGNWDSSPVQLGDGAGIFAGMASRSKRSVLRAPAKPSRR